ncbi:MAG: indolepyruvate ferredoxin oxidoreductase family protein, partial [Sulfurifustis sp.]
GAKSSTQAAQSDFILMAVGIPVLAPANVQDILDFGLHGLAMSRYSGCWIGLKLVTDVVESSSSVYLGPAFPAIVLPESAGDVHIRIYDPPLMQEARLYQNKLHAVLAYVRANGINRVVLDAPAPRLGIVAAGKAYADVRQALLELGMDDAAAVAAGVRLLKVGMVWPLDPEIILSFTDGLDAVLIVEEKRPLLEEQIKSILFDAGPSRRVRIVGKYDAANVWASARGEPVLSGVGELAPPQIAAQIAKLLGRAVPEMAVPVAPARAGSPVRMPNFCSGCPHNISTQLPEGSRALAGIGCHGMAIYKNPLTTGMISHMGGEGVMWVGQAPFTNEPHVFANLGDGTYFHSGFLAIRQAVAAKTTITYKLLVNGFVSMTGGQPVDGDLSVPRMVTELLAEGVSKIVVVADDLTRYEGVTLPHEVALRPRHETEAVQRELRATPGVTVMIYDQMCAAERRRLRKRDQYPDPTKRTFINADVCEGCGDCSTKSGCLSIEPLETELGRKRRINQSSCNKDFSCVEGFCPSFVTVHGGNLRRGMPSARATGSEAFGELPEPVLPAIGASPYGVLVTGIGGSGVVTVGAILAQAAHMDGKVASALDVTGLAQKYGAVMSHVRIGTDPAQLHSARLAAGEADLVVGCDLIVSASDEAVSRIKPGRTHAVLNTEIVPTSEFIGNPDWKLDAADLAERVRRTMNDATRVATVPATQLATSLLGDAIAANMFMLGYAWQRGWVPVSRAAIERAIQLNGVAIEFNLSSFLWGRRAAHDLAAVERRASPASVISFAPARLTRLADIVADRVKRLTDYQNAAYAERYRERVERVARAERALDKQERLAVEVARNYYKLLAHKDEYEVARLHTDPAFQRALAATFEGDYKLHFHLAAGLLAKTDPITGAPRKRELGPWMMPILRVLARMRVLRGSVLDPFRRTADRRLARELLERYEADLDNILAGLTPARLDCAIEIAAWPDKVRGYGHVRERSAQAVAQQRQELWARWGASAGTASALAQTA